jgi:MFS family permease
MGDAAIGPIMMLAAILGIFAYNLNAIVPLIANFILKAGPAGFGNLTAAAGVGSILAAFVLASLGKAEKRTVNVGALGLGGSLLALGLADSWPANSVLLVLYGFFCIIFFTSANTMLQLATRSDMRGRVAGVYILWITGSTPIGSLFIGQMAERFSVHPTLLALGAICTVGTILVIGRGIWRSRRAAGPGVHSPGAEHAGQPPESRGDGD